MPIKNQPYLHLYVQDFMTDEELAQCSAAANGVYIRIMLLLTKTNSYGKLLLKQKYKQNIKQKPSKLPSKAKAPAKSLLEVCYRFALQLDKHLPFDLEVIESALYELVTENVITIEGDYLIQRRMVRDHDISHKRALAGSKGGKKRVKNLHDNTGDFASDFAKAKVQANTKQKHDNDNDNTLYNGMGGAGGKIVTELKNTPDHILNVYKLNYEEFMALGEKFTKGVEESDFQVWKEFVSFCDDDEHQFYLEVYKAKFVFPKDFTRLVKEKHFKREIWLTVFEKMLSVGIKTEHSLWFRIPDAMKWLKRDAGTTPPTSTDQSVKAAGSSKSDYSNNSFKKKQNDR